MRNYVVFALLPGMAFHAARAQQNPVIQAETRVVLVDAIVTGKNGMYVRDLTEKDFHVFQDSKEQPLKSFALEAASTASEPRSLVLFFDETSMEIRDQILARQAASRFIDAETGPNRKMAVAIYDGALRVGQNFTGNAGRLKDALPAPESNLGTEEKSAPGRPVNAAINSAAADLGARNMIRSLRDLGRSLGVLPGRKIVVLFSGAVRPSLDQRSAVREAIEACNRSGVAIYPVDVRPVSVQTELGPAPAGLPADRHPSRNVSSTGLGRGAQAHGDTDDLNAAQNSGASSQQLIFELANGTGGLVVGNTSDLLQGLQAIAAEQDEYYVLTFSPPESKEGTCHTLRVKVDRSGTVVRSRTSYCTTKPQDLLASTAAGKSLENRVAGAQTGNLAASLEMAYFYISPNVARVHAAMEIPAGGLKFANQKGKLHAEINLLGVASASDGAVEARFSDTIKLDFDSQAQIDNWKQKPLAYEKEFKIVPGQYSFTMAFGQGEGNFGKIQAPLVVDPWAGELALSSVALSRATRPAGDLGLGLVTESRTPLVAEGIEVVPSGSNHFAKSESGFFYFEVYGPDAGAALVRVRVLDRKRGEPKWDSGLSRLPVPDGAVRSTIAAGSGLPLNALEAGSYQLEITAEDSAGKAVKRLADFEIQ